MTVSRREAVTRIAAALWVMTGCARQETRPSVLRGVVVEVQAASFLQIASLTLRTDAGEIVALTVEGDVGMSPGHLREHMALGDPVAVTVRYADGQVVAQRIEDASPP